MHLYQFDANGYKNVGDQLYTAGPPRVSMRKYLWSTPIQSYMHSQRKIVVVVNHNALFSLSSSTENSFSNTVLNVPMDILSIKWAHLEAPIPVLLWLLVLFRTAIIFSSSQSARRESRCFGDFLSRLDRDTIVLN